MLPASLVLILRLVFSPALIAVATLIGRRWGPSVSGWFTGFPFVSAPISIVLAIQYGAQFTARSSTGSLGGQASVCLFAAAWIFAARRWTWGWCLLVSMPVFFASAALWRLAQPGLLVSFLGLAAAVALVLAAIPRRFPVPAPAAPARWDIPLRMLTAAVFVFAITGAASWLGPQLSGVLSSFPLFGSILAGFTHAQQGGSAASRLLRGSVLGSFAVVGFHTTIAVLLPLTGVLWVYLPALLMSIAGNTLSLQIVRRLDRPTPAPPA